MKACEQLGMRIRYLRKAKHMSQLDLSLEAGVNKNYISDFEKIFKRKITSNLKIFLFFCV